MHTPWQVSGQARVGSLRACLEAAAARGLGWRGFAMLDGGGTEHALEVD